MRKHNKRFAQRWTRARGDRTNFPQMMAHAFVKDKTNQIMAHGLLHAMIFRLNAII